MVRQTSNKLDVIFFFSDSGVSDASQGEDEPSVERVQVISQPRLINPCEVRVIQPTVYEHAEPVLTPIGEEKFNRSSFRVLRVIFHS